MPNKRRKCWRIYVESEQNSEATRKGEARNVDSFNEFLFLCLETISLICVKQ
jgi:hypothetical protein